MAFAIPGLGQSTSTARSTLESASTSTHLETARSQVLQPRTEWRFEVAFSQRYTITLISGTAEHWGTELVANVPYSFTGYKGAIFTWEGCSLNVAGSSEAEYVGEDTAYAVEWLNVHGALEGLRDATARSAEAPRVLVVGPDQSGKSSLVQTLTAWAVRQGRTPLVVNLDPRQGVLAPPGSFSAVAVSTSLDVELGYGEAGVTGPTAVTLKTPLVQSWPFDNTTANDSAFKQTITRMALNVTGRLDVDPDVKSSGIIIDTPGTLNDPKTSYEQLHHIVSEFSITHILVVNSERLNADLQRRYASEISTERATIVKLRKPAGAVDSDKAFLRQARATQIRAYFFGPTTLTLNPHSHSIPFSDLSIYKFTSTSSEGNAADVPSFGPGVDDDYEPDGTKPLFEPVAPSIALTASLLAVKFCAGTADEAEIRDSSVMGFVYVADVDEARKRVRFLAPHPQRWTNRALVFGPFPEAVPDLVG